jgi:hypothetical protein
VIGQGYRVQGAGFRDELKVQGSGFRDELRVQGEGKLIGKVVTLNPDP